MSEPTMATPVTVVSAALLLAGAAYALDAHASDVTMMQAEAWQTAYDMQGDLLTPINRSRLHVLAWHAAAANLCEPLVLDHTSFGQAYATIEHSDAASLSDQEHTYFRQHLGASFGVAVGITIAGATADPETTALFCQEAVAAAEQAPTNHFFVSAELLSD